MKNLLKTYFGYDEFSPLQEEVIENTMQKKGRRIEILFFAIDNIVNIDYT